MKNPIIAGRWLSITADFKIVEKSRQEPEKKIVGKKRTCLMLQLIPV